MLNPITAKDIQALVVTDGFLQEAAGGMGFSPKPTNDFNLNYFVNASRLRYLEYT